MSSLLHITLMARPAFHQYTAAESTDRYASQFQTNDLTGFFDRKDLILNTQYNVCLILGCLLIDECQSFEQKLAISRHGLNVLFHRVESFSWNSGQSICSNLTSARVIDRLYSFINEVSVSSHPSSEHFTAGFGIQWSRLLVRALVNY